jgi:hypothetical protein
MKYILILSILTLMSACHPNPANYTVPDGYKPCSTNYECDIENGEYCGFVHVDTYAVCRH